MSKKSLIYIQFKNETRSLAHGYIIVVADSDYPRIKSAP